VILWGYHGEHFGNLMETPQEIDGNTLGRTIKKSLLLQTQKEKFNYFETNNTYLVKTYYRYLNMLGFLRPL
jgi:hypothetical protein